MKTPHKHADVIKAWADGAEIERHWENGGWGPVSACPTWATDAEYRVKPAAPARQYPVTGMSKQELVGVYCNDQNESEHSLRAVANEVLRHAIDAGQVVPNDVISAALDREYKRGLARNAEWDMEVARAVFCNIRDGIVNVLNQAGEKLEDIASVERTK
jgi:hypothetical protein